MMKQGAVLLQIYGYDVIFKFVFNIIVAEGLLELMNCFFLLWSFVQWIKFVDVEKGAVI